MRVAIACPHPKGSRSGNRRTAERWARLLRQLGHQVRIVDAKGPVPSADVLVALHAKHSAGIVRASKAERPATRVVLALTGTDLSHDIRVDESALGSLSFADRVVVLHDLAPREVPVRYRKAVRVVRQSAQPPRSAPRHKNTVFEVAVVGHLRDVKDPFRAALAARLLPKSSRVRVVHAGGALEPSMARGARHEATANARYVWLGELTPAKSLALIARARLFVLSSVSEGGANVLGEAIVCGTPVIASDIPASRAALGADYPGLYEVGDERMLSALIRRAEEDPKWLATLERRIRRRRPLFTEQAEKRALRDLLRELTAHR